MTPDRLTGSLLGTAVGDALGLPYEGLSPRRAARLFPDPSRHHLLLGRGMVSDDTDHACMTAQALLASGGDPDRLARDLARRLRWWLAALPAGVGLATARSIVKLWLGVPPQRSGVRSAGNGPAMRAPLIGAYARDPQHLVALVTASTRITHTDPRALHGAMAVALATHLGARTGRLDPTAFARLVDAHLPRDAAEFRGLIERTLTSIVADESTLAFAHSLGLEGGVSGFIAHTVPVCLHAAFRSRGDFRSAVLAVIICGGDTDTTAAITGGILGATLGESAIPAEWIAGLLDWPWSPTRIRRLGAVLAAPDSSMSSRIFPVFPAVLLRNAVFLGIVLSHGARRALPPY